MPRDDVDDFWDVIERVRAGADHAEFTDALTLELARLPVPRIVRFHLTAIRLANRALTWEMWAAADIVYARHEYCGEYSFVGFRLWLFRLGRDTFEDALADPDSLGEVPELVALAARPSWTDAEYPDTQELCGVAETAYELVLARLAPAVAAQLTPPAEFAERPDREPRTGRPLPHDEALKRERFPRLTGLFRRQAHDADCDT
ncbi:DUF4240 domain-containing protein [Catellatospora sp. NPDC049609]|uniref:DUF4240 domain-containing protein n=1 Tax=Catellatospora sp. NPDC049609 TaxID=3155505 RepID=UPI00342A6684